MPSAGHTFGVKKCGKEGQKKVEKIEQISSLVKGDTGRVRMIEAKELMHLLLFFNSRISPIA